MSSVVVALFVQTDGVYFRVRGVDPWDHERDARAYQGPHPVVAHPPCARWGSFARMMEVKSGVAIGNDDGCFKSALASVESFGGVLEHPARSRAWYHFGIRRPHRGCWVRTRRGWTTELYQARYGHPTPKPTWLYYVGRNPPPELDWTYVRSTGRVIANSWHRRTPYVSHQERIVTPKPFRNLLVRMARGCGGAP